MKDQGQRQGLCFKFSLPEINIEYITFSPIFLFLTLVYQISFMVFKYLKTRTFYSASTDDGKKKFSLV